MEDCWYYQVAYWIQEDVAKTIAKINSRSKSISSSPVKRLLGINFQNPDAQKASDDTDCPIYVTALDLGTAMPWTERLCNDDLDVVHFSVAVVVRSKSVLAFMKELCSEKEHKPDSSHDTADLRAFRHNQITILQSEIKPFNRTEPEHRLYNYGDDAVVALNLVCEYIFKKAGYDDLKPDSVKITLGQKTD